MFSITETLQPSCSNRSRTAGPERSLRVPLLTESLMVSTAASIIRSLPAEVSAFSACFFEQIHLADLDRFVQRFYHVIDRQGRDGRRGERFHLDSGRRIGRSRSGDADPFLLNRDIHVGVRERQRLT